MRVDRETLPGRSGGVDQHLPGRGSGFAHGIPGRADAGTASSCLIAIESAGSGLLDFNLLPVGFEFLGEDHRQGGADTLLIHLGAGDHDRDLVVVWRDAQIRVWGE